MSGVTGMRNVNEKSNTPTPTPVDLRDLDPIQIGTLDLNPDLIQDQDQDLENLDEVQNLDLVVQDIKIQRQKVS